MPTPSLVLAAPEWANSPKVGELLQWILFSSYLFHFSGISKDVTNF